jgi:hypothetical protein
MKTLKPLKTAHTHAFVVGGPHGDLIGLGVELLQVLRSKAQHVQAYGMQACGAMQACGGTHAGTWAMWHAGT